LFAPEVKRSGLSRDQTLLYATIDIFFPVHGKGDYVGAQSETNLKWPAQPARRGGRSLSEFRHDPASISSDLDLTFSGDPVLIVSMDARALAISGRSLSACFHNSRNSV